MTYETCILRAKLAKTDEDKKFWEDRAAKRKPIEVKKVEKPKRRGK